MSGGWSPDELGRLGDAIEVEVASQRADGTLRPYTVMWAGRIGDHLYVRSAGGPDRPWYRHALAGGTGRIRAGGIERDVSFTDAGHLDADVHDALDAAYHAKYDRFGPGPVGHVTGPDAWPVTIRLEQSSGSTS